MPDEILGGYQFPLPDPNFASLDAFEKFLNQREIQKSELIAAVGFYTDPASGKPAGNYYKYRPLPIGMATLPQRLHVLPVNAQWEKFLDEKIDLFEVVNHSEVILNDAPVEVVVFREREHPIAATAAALDTILTTTVPGWDWLKPKIVGDDLVVEGQKCTWFGGPNDREDNGETASGKVNTRQQPDFLGCSLPMSGFRYSRNTAGSPLPRFKWLTPVEVTCIEDDLKGRQIEVPLIDLGPARSTQHALDLTESAFHRLGASSSRGVIKVDFRIRNWRQHLEPGATFSPVPASSSEQKPLDGNNLKIRPLPDTGEWDAAGFAAFIASLGLAFFRADEMLPCFFTQRNGVKNQPPPKALWANIAPTLLVIDRLRSLLNAPIHLTSTYRCPAYNRQLDGSATLSQHMAFRATDIQAVGKTPTEVHRALQGLRGQQIAIPANAQFSAASMVNSGNGIDPATPFRLAGLQIQDPTAAAPGSFVFAGGLGLYQTFVHVDCRGGSADW